MEHSQYGGERWAALQFWSDSNGLWIRNGPLFSFILAFSKVSWHCSSGQFWIHFFRPLPSTPLPLDGPTSYLLIVTETICSHSQSFTIYIYYCHMYVWKDPRSNNMAFIKVTLFKDHPFLVGHQFPNPPNLRKSCGRRLPRAWRARQQSRSSSAEPQGGLWKRLKRLRPRSVSREAQREVEEYVGWGWDGVRCP